MNVQLQFSWHTKTWLTIIFLGWRGKVHMPDLISLIPSFCPGYVAVVSSVIGQLSLVVTQKGRLYIKMLQVMYNSESARILPH